jgi:NhaP-type Na+/H+ or K+/H+ antiporter
MKYTLASLPGRTRALIMLLLLVATPVIVYTDGIPGFFAGFSGGLLVGLVLGELAVYLKRKSRL